MLDGYSVSLGHSLARRRRGFASVNISALLLFVIFLSIVLCLPLCPHGLKFSFTDITSDDRRVMNNRAEAIGRLSRAITSILKSTNGCEIHSRNYEAASLPLSLIFLLAVYDIIDMPARCRALLVCCAPVSRQHGEHEV